MKLGRGLTAPLGSVLASMRQMMGRCWLLYSKARRMRADHHSCLRWEVVEVCGA